MEIMVMKMINEIFDNTYAGRVAPSSVSDQIELVSNHYTEVLNEYFNDDVFKVIINIEQYPDKKNLKMLTSIFLKNIVIGDTSVMKELSYQAEILDKMIKDPSIKDMSIHCALDEYDVLIYIKSSAPHGIYIDEILINDRKDGPVRPLISEGCEDVVH